MQSISLAHLYHEHGLDLKHMKMEINNEQGHAFLSITSPITKTKYYVDPWVGSKIIKYEEENLYTLGDIGKVAFNCVED